jgi:hypothetical protein
MAVLSYEIYRLLEEEPEKEKADKVEEKAREQKPILKAELKEEFYGEMKALRIELEKKISEVEVRLERRLATVGKNYSKLYNYA